MAIKDKERYFKQIASYYESFLNLSNDAVFIVDPEMVIQDASNRFCEICGIGRSELIGYNLKNISIGLDKTSSKYLIWLFNKTLKKGRLNKQPFSFVENGKQRHFEISTSLINESKDSASLIICSMNDITELIKAKNVAIENKRKLKTLFDNLNGFAYRCKNDKSWTMEFVSAAFKKITGYDIADIINNKNISYADLIIPEDREQVWDKVQEALGQKMPFELKYRVTTANGNTIYIEEQGIGVFSEHSGELIAIEGYINDISNKVEQHNALIRSENINRSITQSAVDAILTVDHQGIVISWNNAANKTFGFHAVDMIGKSVQKIIPERYKKMHEAGIARLRKGGKEKLIGKTIEISALNKSGEEFPVELSLSRWDIDNNNFYTAIIRDISSRKKSEERLIKLSTAVEQSPSVIMITDIEGNIEYVNPKFTELTGFEKKEVLGQNPRFLKSGKQTDEFYEEFWKTITTGKTWSGDIHNRKKSGELFWEKVIVSPIFDDDGRLINFIKVAEDINLQKKAILQLQKSEKKYRRLIETTTEGFWLIDTKSITVDVNNSLCKILGYPKEKILGKTPFEFVDDESLKVFKYWIAKSRIDEQRVYEISLRNKDGNNIPCLFNATTMLDETGKFAGSFAFVTDIREQKRSQLVQKILYNISKSTTNDGDLGKLIEIIQREVNQVVDATNFYVALYDDETDMFSFPFYSDTYDKFENYPARKTLTKIVIDSKKPLLADTKTKEELVKQGLLDYVGTKSKVWLGAPLKIEDEVFGVFAVQNYNDENAYNEDDMEIMEIIADQISISIYRKQTDEELKLALKKATESDRLKSSFLQNISHEIRTPMNGILGFTGLLLNSSISAEEMQEYVGIINESGNRMLGTLDDVMNISLLETDQVEVVKSVINVNDELKNQYDYFLQEAENMNIEFDLATKLPHIKAGISTDHKKFNTIVSNLLDNAFKYTSKGKIEFGYSHEHGFLRFYVSDTGIGIPANRLQAVFESFVQAEIKDVKAKEGTGLGLSIAKAYVELLGGKIWAESETDKGTTFYFTIPYQPIRKAGVKAAVTSGNTGLKALNLKILIAEDEEVSSEFLNIIMAEYCREILFAKNGIETLNITKENPDLDLIFMDIKLPLMSGYKASREIRKFNKNVVIIVQTAYATRGDRDKALNAGCNYYFSKPINAEELIETIVEHFK
ncbi:MAG: PAS domain S-box protein [Chlorobi bacterium]|nr:PAS domain S-box protein [Chlorobiota bacterium]